MAKQTCQPKRVVLADDPDIDWGRSEAMEFRLTYQGRLLGASRSQTRAEHKHEIRRQFHKQLARAWEVLPPLNGAGVGTRVLATSAPHRHDIETLSAKYGRCGYNFVPLATEDMFLSCALEILFIRPGTPGVILSSGDIDNRLKTLFDALRMPKNSDELGGYLVPSEGESPFFCLMEDDSLISKVTVETDVLLEPISTPENVNDARLVIKVMLKPYRTNLDNLNFA